VDGWMDGWIDVVCSYDSMFPIYICIHTTLTLDMDD